MIFDHQRPCLKTAGALMFFCGLFFGSVALAQVPFGTPPSDDLIQPIDAAKTETASAPVGSPPSETPPAADVKMVPAKEALSYFKTYLVLQRQNALLEKLLEREEMSLRTAESYGKIGFPYEPSKPALSLCREVPANMACATAYPDLYAGFMPAPSEPVMPNIPMPEKSAVISAPDAGLPQDIDQLSPDAAIKELMWTDITCLQSICRAVITPDPGNAKARYAVNVGDQLPPGGVVQSISSNGVTIAHGKDMITLLPAPTRPFGLGQKTF